MTKRMPARAGLSVHATGREKLKGHLAMLLFAVLIAGSFSFGGLAARYMEAEPLMLWPAASSAALMTSSPATVLIMTPGRTDSTFTV